MPAQATPIDQLPDAQRAVLADVKRVTDEIAALEGSLRALTTERHNLFVRASEAGVATVTIAAVAGVSGPAVSKVLAARGGS